jgi:hypothetical protein
MSKSSQTFDFRKPVACDPEAKRAFHTKARRKLKQLADTLGLPPGGYDLRSNQGGIAVMWNALTEGPRIGDESAGLAHGSRSFTAADSC